MESRNKILSIFLFTFFFVWCIINFSFAQNQEKIDFLQDLKEKYINKRKADTIVNQIYLQIYAEYQNNDPTKSIETAHEAIQYFKFKENPMIVASWYDNLGGLYHEKDIHILALEAYLNSLKISSENGENLGWNYINIGNVYYSQGINTLKAKKEYYKALDEFEKFEESQSETKNLGKAVVFNNLALIHLSNNKPDSALFYAKEALKIRIELNKSEELAHSHLLIGKIFHNKTQYDSAIYYYNTAEEYAKKDYFLEFYTSIIIGRALSYAEKNEFKNAFTDLYNAEKIALKKSKFELENVYKSFSHVYKIQGQNDKAIEFAHKAIKYCDSLQMEKEKLDLLKIIISTYEKTNKIDSAYKYQSQYLAVNANLKKDEIEKIKYNYEFEEELKETSILQKNIVQLTEKSNTRLLLLIISAVLILVSLFFGTIILRSRKDTSDTNQELYHSLNIISNEKDKIELINQELLDKNIETEIQKNKIEEFAEELKKQKEQIESAHKDITDSIEYAKTIQTALLPGTEILSKLFKDYLIFFEPKEAVSGDFYYANKIYNYDVFAVADCTGHGVPGAFLSILAISHLNEILRKKETKTTAGVLNLLRTRIKGIFKFFGTENHNGLDIALCAIDSEKKILQYSGAFNPLIIVRDNKIIEYKATRNPVGFYLNEIPFENHEISIQENDIFYVFSDGYYDQIGGERDKKFSKKAFKNLILEISSLPLSEQKLILHNQFVKWKNNGEQLDDATIFAFKWRP